MYAGTVKVARIQSFIYSVLYIRVYIHQRKPQEIALSAVALAT